MGAGTTIDQIAALELGKDTQLASLELALYATDTVPMEVSPARHL